MNLTDQDILWEMIKGSLNTPYKWGGDDPMAGWDCSGFVQAMLRPFDILPKDKDFTAADMFNFLKGKAVYEPHFGCLVFFYKEGSPPHHVEICLNAKRSVGASGGNSETVNEGQAIVQNAYVQVKSIERGLRTAFINPFLKG